MDVAQRVRDSGKRMTIQRRLVLESLERAKHHTTAEEIAARIRKQHPQIDPSTVYRNLEALEEAGIAHHVHVGHSAGRYVLSGRDSGGYVACERCGRHETFDAAALRRRVEEVTGFACDFMHFPLVGICSECDR